LTHPRFRDLSGRNFFHWHKISDLDLEVKAGPNIVKKSKKIK